MDSQLARSIETRLLDQCVLDDVLLVSLADEDPAHAARMAKLERRLALRRVARQLPVLGPLARGVYQRITQAGRSRR